MSKILIVDEAAFPMLAAKLFQQVMDADYDREEVSALFKVLQKPA